MENPVHRILFLRGSLAGKTFRLDARANAAVGRSRSCEIRLTEPDASGRHVLLKVSANGVALENLSARVTRLDGQPLALGEERPLAAGAKVELGGGVEFTLESVPAADAGAGAETRPGGADPDATRAPETAAARRDATAPPEAAGRDAGEMTHAAGRDAAAPPDTRVSDSFADEGLTQALQTRMATPEEIESLRETHTRQRRFKTGSYAAVSLLALAGFTALYLLFANRPPEQTLDFRMKESREVFLESEKWAGLICPDPAERPARVRQDAGTIVADTWIGRGADVPLRLELRRFVPGDNAALRESRAESFDAWRAENKDLTEGFKELRVITDSAFIGEGHGVRCVLCRHRRTRAGENGEAATDWIGLAAFFRSRDACYVYLCELPVSEEFRGSRLIQIPETFLIIEPPFVRGHWEGCPPGELDGREAAELLKECEALDSVGKAMEWDRMERHLTSALVQLWPRRDDPAAAELCDTALQKLQKLRKDKQARIQQFLVRRKLAAAADDKKLGAAIDAAARELFSSQEDARHYRVRAEKWWEDGEWKE
ncbi:MAG: FHA domain-containing protein [Kiritimatiellaeota bacterium]|nr:FHA domain-containing protein [Kiritimatiellota bacterium]